MCGADSHRHPHPHPHAHPEQVLSELKYAALEQQTAQVVGMLGDVDNDVRLPDPAAHAIALMSRASRAHERRLSRSRARSPTHEPRLSRS